MKAHELKPEDTITLGSSYGTWIGQWLIEIVEREGSLIKVVAQERDDYGRAHVKTLHFEPEEEIILVHRPVAGPGDWDKEWNNA